MRWTIRLECEGSDESVVIGHIDRQDALQAAAFGVSLVESKQILTGLQLAVVQRQFRASRHLPFADVCKGRIRREICHLVKIPDPD